MAYQTGRFDSWNIVSDEIAEKECDKSFFVNNGSEIPAQVRWFFDAENMEPGQNKNEVMKFGDRIYDLRINKETNELGRTMMFWPADFSRAFAAKKKKPADQLTARFYNDYEGLRVEPYLTEVELFNIHQIQELLNSLGMNNHILKGTSNMVQLGKEGEQATTIHVRAKGFVLYSNQHDYTAILEEEIFKTKPVQLDANQMDRAQSEKKIEEQAFLNPDLVFCIDDGNKIYNQGPNYQPHMVYVYSNDALKAVINMIRQEQRQRGVSVNDAVWIAAAVMAYEKYYGEKKRNIGDFWFKQADIVDRAGDFTDENVDAARVSQWCCGDHENHSHAYLREVKKNEDHKYRRLAFLNEFADEETEPSGLDMNQNISVSSGTVTLQTLYDFVHKEYSAMADQVLHKQSKKVWLMTWNPSSWRWDNYSDWAVRTKKGEKFIESWTCSSKQPELGDDVYLMKTGDQPRGIVAHGCIVRTAYDALHYDEQKAAQGVMVNHVDVEFDWILDADEESIILQEGLKKAFPNQEWSPTGSGISINDEYATELAQWWQGIKNGTFDNAAAYDGLSVDIEKVVDYLKKYTGAKYTKPENAGNRAAEMQTFKEAGTEARRAFIELGNIIAPFLPGYVAEKCSNWVNQHQEVHPYFWIEFKKAYATSYMHSLALSVNTFPEHDPSGPLTISFRIDLKDRQQGRGKNNDYDFHNRQIDLEVPAESKVFFQGEAPDGSTKNYGKDIDTIKEAINSGEIKKLKAVIAVDDPYTNDRSKEIIKDLVKAALELRKYYEYILEIRGIKPHKKGEYWPSQEDYPVDISKEQWKGFIEDVERTHKGCMRVLKCYIEVGGVASPKKMSELYGGHANVYTMSISNTSKRALKYFDMQPCPDAIFPITFLGKHGTGDDAGLYVYKMREELFDALSEMDLGDIRLEYQAGEEEMTDTGFGKNLILYGPPGTGKTYNTVKYAVAICEGNPLSYYDNMDYSEIKKKYDSFEASGFIAFTTFHQSYGYEEFIEGIKPLLKSEEATNDSKDIKYDVIPGVFKKFCDDASMKWVDFNDVGVEMNEKIWKVTVRENVRQDCFDNDRVRIDFNMDDEYASGFVNDIEAGNIIITTDGSRTTINGIATVVSEEAYELDAESDRLTRNVKWLAKNINHDITGINDNKILHRMTVARVPHMRFQSLLPIITRENPEAIKGEEKDNRPYVFIIDEINRGNISKIFGELITLIETTKRAGEKEAMETILPYSKQPFSVPNNVYILGTMNTADRSIALMDTALRRRFEFVEMMPDLKVIDGLEIVDNGVTLNVSNMLKAINDRIEYLFDREHTIGHAFFTGLIENPTLKELAAVFRKKVIPLLQEYFYEDYDKIQLVLGDNLKSSDDYKFILDTNADERKLFKGSVNLDIKEKTYSVQDKAFDYIQSYIEITETKKVENSSEQTN